jgi:hypothetical protein
VTINALNEEHLRRILRDYARYHHEDRLNDSVGGTRRTGASWSNAGLNAKVASIARLGGLRHRYTWD